MSICVCSITAQQEIVIVVHAADLFPTEKAFAILLHPNSHPFAAAAALNLHHFQHCSVVTLFMRLTFFFVHVFHVTWVSLWCLYLLLSLLRILFLPQRMCMCACGTYVCVFFWIFFQSVLFKSTIFFAFR